MSLREICHLRLNLVYSGIMDAKKDIPIPGDGWSLVLDPVSCSIGTGLVWYQYIRTGRPRLRNMAASRNCCLTSLLALH